MAPVVVVTGAGGWLGRRLCIALAASGAEVVAVSRRAHEIKGCELYRVGDYSETPAPAGARLVHLAETASIAEAETAGEKYLETVPALLRTLLQKGYDHVVYASSGVVYGDATARPHGIDDPVRPAGIYGRAKLAAEAHAIASGGTVARLSNIYGPGTGRGTVVSDIVERLACDGPLRIGNGGTVRDFLWCDDAARGLAALALGAIGGIVHLSTGIGTPVRHLAERALALAGQAGRPILETAPLDRVSALVLDPTATTKACGWRAETKLDDGLSRLIGARP